jgi:hypothetical protein
MGVAGGVTLFKALTSGCKQSIILKRFGPLFEPLFEPRTCLTVMRELLVQDTNKKITVVDRLMH